MNMIRMTPKHWIPFLKPQFSDEELAAIEIAGKTPDDFHERLTALQQRFLHLVREKIIQGNISGVDPEIPLYRTMTCENFHRMIVSRTLHLTNPLVWASSGDSWEASIIAGGVYVMPRNSEDRPKCVTEAILEGLKRWYGQSWSLTKECDAIWSRYSQGKSRAVQVATTARKLLWVCSQTDRFYRTTFLDKVRYLSDCEIVNAKRQIRAPLDLEKSIRRLLTLKRRAFEYENEVRLLYWDEDGKNHEHSGDYLDFPLDGTISVSDFIDDVILDPDSPDSCIEAESAFLRENGISVDVKISTLKIPPEDPSIVHIDNWC